MNIRPWPRLAQSAEDIKFHYRVDTISFRIALAACLNPSIVAASIFRITGAAQGPSHRVFRWITLQLFASDISQNVMIEPGVSFPHPTGLVLGRGATVRSGCTLYQHVTLGTNRLAAGYPTVEPNSTIYTGAVIVGLVTIGPNAVVGALVFVNSDVPSGTVISR